MSEHNKRVVSEFSRKADLYAQSEALNDVGALNLLAETAGLVADDVVLDVACGPGVVSCYLAGTARSVVGVDLTEAMLEQARINQDREGLQNVSWVLGDVSELPLPDGAFSLVVSRYALHHVLEPKAVLHEMIRACSERGRVVVVDVAVPDTKLSEDFNTAERLRDPSHVRALSAREQRDLLTDSGLTIRSAAEYRVEYELEHLLEFSSASERDKHRIRELLAADESPFFERREERSFVRYPIVLYVASRGAFLEQ